MNFLAIDVETSNANLASICQIGVAKYIEGILTQEWITLLNPDDFFDPINISIHGIDEDLVKDAPKFPEIFNKLSSYLDGQVVVSHTHFDRIAINQAIEKYNCNNILCTWLDTARVARRAWKEFSKEGYGLQNICINIGYEFRHHNALEDAKASAQILLKAIQDTELSLDDWLKRIEQPINITSSSLHQNGNPEGEFYGEVIAFTGALLIPRRQAADLATSVGFQVASGVTQKITYLVVGDQDINRLAGYKKSSKHRKAEELISKGLPIRILKESDFMALISL